MKIKSFLSVAVLTIITVVISFGFVTAVKADTISQQGLIQNISQRLSQLEQQILQMLGHNTASVVGSTSICTQDSNCGTNGFTGNPFCQNGSVYQSYTTYTCFGGWAIPGGTGAVNGNGCSSSTATQLVQTCPSGQICSNGSCVSSCTPNRVCVPGLCSDQTKHDFLIDLNNCDPASSPQNCDSNTQHNNYTDLKSYNCGPASPFTYYGSTYSITYNYDSSGLLHTVSTPACIPSWQCSGFGACTNNQQTQTCTDSNNCGLTTGQPTLTQQCGCQQTSSGATGMLFGKFGTYSNTCSQQNGFDYATIYTCVNNAVYSSMQSCTPGACVGGQCYKQCNPNWQCHWGLCTNGSQSQVLFDANNCGVPASQATTTCSDITQSCSTNSPGQCTQDSDCGTNGYVGAPVCLSDGLTVGKNYIFYSCKNPNSAQSTCTDWTSTLSVGITCPQGQTCNNGTCSAASIIFTSPQGGEQWKVGETHNITWQNIGISNPTNLTINLIKPDGTVVAYFAGGTNTGSYSLTIPEWFSTNTFDPFVTGSYEIQIGTSGMNAQSNPFTISSGDNCLTGTYPNASGLCVTPPPPPPAPKTNCTPNWTCGWDPICGGDGTQYHTPVDSNNCGFAPSDVQKLACTSAGSRPCSPSIKITSPQSGGVWTAGNQYNITWDAEAVTTNATVSIKLISTSGVLGMSHLIANVPAALEGYSFIFPSIGSTLNGLPTIEPGSYEISIALNNSSAYVGSIATFRVVADNTSTCTPNWQCSGFGTCANGQQAQTCIDLNNCGATTGEPALTQSCAASTPTTTDNSALIAQLQAEIQSLTQQIQQILAQQGNTTTTIQTPPQTSTTCAPKWGCGLWSTCINGNQTRICNDLNGCGTTTGEPPLTQACQTQPGIVVISPGAVLYIGQAYNLTWNESGLDGTNVIIALNNYSVNSNSGYVPTYITVYIATSTPASSGSYNFTMPTTVPPGIYKITISSQGAVNGSVVSGSTDYLIIDPPNTCTPNWTCGDWSACSNGQQTRTCTGDGIPGCTATNQPALTQTCSTSTTICTPNWTCTAWSACANGSQSRTCSDSNNCGVLTGQPAYSQSCTSTSANTLALKSSFAPGYATINTTYQVKCDFGSVLPCIVASSGGQGCTFASFAGTTAIFNCKSTTTGAKDNYCNIFNYSQNPVCVAQTNKIHGTTATTAVVDSCYPMNCTVPSNVVLSTCRVGSCVDGACVYSVAPTGTACAWTTNGQQTTGTCKNDGSQNGKCCSGSNCNVLDENALGFGVYYNYGGGCVSTSPSVATAPDKTACFSPGGTYSDGMYCQGGKCVSPAK